MQREPSIAIVALVTAAAIGCRSAQPRDCEEPVCVIESKPTECEPTVPQPTLSHPNEVSFVPKTVEIDGETYRYAVYVPDNYGADRAWPAIMFLNGAGERGNDGMRQTTAGIGNAIRQHPERFPCIVILPQCRDEMRWEEEAMSRLALRCLDAAERDYRIDPRRIALTGLSLGGFGTWKLGAEYPERFRVLGPICGGGNPATARQLAKTPIWCFHGDADPVVPADRSREMVAAVQVADGDVRYSELPGTGHNSWDAAYGDPEFIAWLLEDAD